MPALLERHQDSDSDSDSDSDDDVPHAAPVQQDTHNAGASHAEAPQQGASQEQVVYSHCTRRSSDLTVQWMPCTLP